MHLTSVFMCAERYLKERERRMEGKGAAGAEVVGKGGVK